MIGLFGWLDIWLRCSIRSYTICRPVPIRATGAARQTRSPRSRPLTTQICIGPTPRILLPLRTGPLIGEVRFLTLTRRRLTQGA